MGEAANRIRSEIASTRAALDARLDVIERRAKDTLDPRGHVAARPWMAIGAAVSTGMVLGLLTGGHRGRGNGSAPTGEPARPAGRGGVGVGDVMEKLLPLAKLALLMALERAKADAARPSAR